MAPHVCIIGAGVSGLRCATVLLEHDYEVTIIEARDRIGGRIAQSDHMGPLEVDIGANWVHSTGYNPIVNLAKETGTPLHIWKESTILVDGEGHLVSPTEANKALNQVWGILERAIEHSTNSSDTLHPTASLFSFFEDSCQEAYQKGVMTTREKELVLGMSQMWGAYVGDSVDRQSLKFFFLEDCINGDDCFIPTNYQKIIAHISETPLRKAHIFYDTTMVSIETCTDQPSTVVLSTSNGKQQHYDDIVITTPLGWLKQHKDSISPLYPRILSAIDAISFGRLEKVLIEFPFAFWETGATDAAKCPDGKGWRLECVSFHAFEKPYRRNILLFYTFGDCSSYITGCIQGLEGRPRDEWLRTFFEPYYSRLPGYSTNCGPIRFLATEWCNDHFAGNGSYSNFQVGIKNAARDVEAIRHGMPEKHIYFAGEHTAPFDGLGTVAGAYISGERVARRIVESRQPR